MRSHLTPANGQAAATITALLGGLLGFSLLSVAAMAAHEGGLNPGITFWIALPTASVVGALAVPRFGYAAAGVLTIAAICWAYLALWAVAGIAALEIEIALLNLAGGALSAIASMLDDRQA